MYADYTYSVSHSHDVEGEMKHMWICKRRAPEAFARSWTELPYGIVYFKFWSIGYTVCVLNGLEGIMVRKI